MSSLCRNIRRTASRRSRQRKGVRDLRGGQSGRRVSARGDFFIWIRHNPLKSPDSTKGIQGNPRNFPWFSLHFLARNSPDSCICDASSSVSSGLPIGSPLSAGSVDNALGARRGDPERGPQAGNRAAPTKNPGAFAPGLSISTDRNAIRSNG